MISLKKFLDDLAGEGHPFLGEGAKKTGQEPAGLENPGAPPPGEKDEAKWTGRSLRMNNN
jgi:hypothetical protein